MKMGKFWDLGLRFWGKMGEIWGFGSENGEIWGFWAEILG